MPRNSINVYKRPDEPRTIPKFSMILLFGLIFLCRKIKAGEGSVRMSFRTRRWHVPLGTMSLLERSSGLQEAYTKACPNSAKKFTATCWCHVMTPCQVSWFLGVFWIYFNQKTKFLNLFGKGTKPRCVNFIPISRIRPINSPKDTHAIFQPTMMHWSMCL